MATPTNLPATAVSGEILTAAYVNNLRGAFRVLQVVSATPYSTEVTSSSLTYVDTGITATITPQSATSKILVLTSVSGVAKNNNTGVSLRLMRGASEIIVFENQAGNDASSSFNLIGTCSTVYLDSPATTSATTYKVQFRSASNISFVAVQKDSASASTMVLMEISA
jgi:hypothetical protein